jgi:hypothetical protein
MLGGLDQTGQNQSGNLRPVVVLGYLFAVGLVIVAVVTVRQLSKQHKADVASGVTRFGTLTLQGRTLRIRGASYTVTRGTHAEVVGNVSEARRSTATRTLAGGVVAGPVGAIVGHSAKKKTRSSSAILTIDGDEWTESVQVAATSYAEAVRFAQAVNLAARRP